MAEPKANEPQGVIAIVTSPDGHVIATVADFARDGYGGCKLWEAQRMRATKFVWWEVVKAYSSPVLSDDLGDYLLDQIGEALRRKGHKLTLRAVGYSEEMAAEIERR